MELPSGITEREFGDGARDPFVRQYPAVADAPIDPERVSLGDSDLGPGSLGPLAQYPVNSLSLLAIMTRTAEPKAMFLPPDGTQRAVLARVDDRVGPNGRGRIVDIQPNRVIIRYEGFGLGEGEEGGTTVEIRLRPEPLNIDDYVFEPY
jgi:Tfp pilus assembly protein PilP